MADTYLPDIMDGLKKVIAADWDRKPTPAPRFPICKICRPR